MAGDTFPDSCLTCKCAFVAHDCLICRIKALITQELIELLMLLMVIACAWYEASLMHFKASSATEFLILVNRFVSCHLVHNKCNKEILEYFKALLQVISEGFIRVNPLQICVEKTRHSKAENDKTDVNNHELFVCLNTFIILDKAVNSDKSNKDDSHINK